MPLTLPRIPAHSLFHDASASDINHIVASAFGPAAHGILLVSNPYPQFSHDTNALFAAGRQLATLSSQHLAALEFPHLNYTLAWSRGRESFKHAVDTNKASYYANPVYDCPAQHQPHLIDQYPHYMHPNHWPSQPSCSSFEPYFKKIGRHINQIAIRIAHHCDNFIRNTLGPDVQFSSLEHSLATSRAAKARFLNYYPSTPTDSNHGALWCGYHNDHATLTGLLPAQFYSTTDLTPIEPPDHTSGLYVVPSNAQRAEHIYIPPNCIAFQIGEAAQIASAGVLRATPHCVRMPHKSTQHIARTTFAVFLQPNPWSALRMPANITDEMRQRALHTSTLVPPLDNGRYQPNDSYGQFAARTINSYVHFDG